MTELQRLQEEIAVLKRKLNTPMPGEMRNELAAIQARYDDLAAHFGQTALPPLPGETPLQYRRRMLAPFLKHSPQFQHVRSDSLDEATIGGVEVQVIKDAQADANNPANYKPYELRPIKFKDESGRELTRHVGDINGWLQHFTLPGAVGRIRRPHDPKWID